MTVSDDWSLFPALVIRHSDAWCNAKKTLNHLAMIITTSALPRKETGLPSQGRGNKPSIAGTARRGTWERKYAGVDLMNSVKGVRRHGGVYHTGWRHFTQGVEKRERAMRGANSSHTKEPTQVAGGNCLISGRPRSENSATTTSSRTPPSSPR